MNISGKCNLVYIVLRIDFRQTVKCVSIDILTPIGYNRLRCFILISFFFLLRKQIKFWLISIKAQQLQ